MILTVKNGTKITIKSMQESLTRDKKSTILNIYSSDKDLTMDKLIQILTEENISEINISGAVSNDTFTQYTQIVDISRRSSDFDFGFDIRLAKSDYSISEI